MTDPLTFGGTSMESDFYGHRLNPLLRQIVLDGAEYAFQRHGWLFHVTSVIRTPEEDRAINGSGLHVVGRAVDIRTKDQKKEVVDDVCLYINGIWVYDERRPQLLVFYAKPHGTGPHLHAQVAMSTKKRVKT